MYQGTTAGRIIYPAGYPDTVPGITIIYYLESILYFLKYE